MTLWACRVEGLNAVPPHRSSYRERPSEGNEKAGQPVNGNVTGEVELSLLLVALRRRQEDPIVGRVIVDAI